MADLKKLNLGTFIEFIENKIKNYDDLASTHYSMGVLKTAKEYEQKSEDLEELKSEILKNYI